MSRGSSGSDGAVMEPGTVVRTLSSGDLEDLERLLRSAIARGDIAASADSDGTYFLRYAALDRARVAVAAHEGGLVGLISPEFKLIVVEPSWRRRGVGRRLVDAGVAIELERGRPELLIGVMPDDDSARAFLHATRFAYHSTLWELTLASDRAVPEPAWPSALTARPFDRTRDVDAFVSVFNASFADHATPFQLDSAHVELLDDPEHEDADTLLLTPHDAPAEAIAFCATMPRRPGGVVADEAEIWTLGVRPGWQGRGLGRQLLRWGVGRLRSIGARRIKLAVNGRNERALALYESEGFERERTRERWARSVDSTGSATAR